MEDLVHGDITKHVPQDILQFLGTVDHPKPCLGKHLVLEPEVELSDSGERQLGCGRGERGKGREREREREGEGEGRGGGGKSMQCGHN